MDASKLLNPERRMLKMMQLESAKDWTLKEILVACNWDDQAVAVGAGLGLSNLGLVELKESVETVIKLSSQGVSAIENGLLESRLWSWISSVDDADMSSLQQSFERHEAGPGVGLLKRIGVELSGGKFVSDNHSQVEKIISERSSFLSNLPDLVENLNPDMVEHFRGR
ncbi:MAG: hypothetical protein QF479_01460, partial [Candidatus Poseidoniaceae archaeon]|nr:hypothetical protein [Candidatus Poseidoniaceae archaeon]